MSQVLIRTVAHRSRIVLKQLMGGKMTALLILFAMFAERCAIVLS
jgi:hypothetical protein